MVVRDLDKLRNMSARNTRIIGIMFACICVCLAFVLGFFVRGDQSLMEHLGFANSLNETDEGSNALSGDSRSEVSARLAEVEEMIARESLDSYDIDSSTTAVMEAFTGATNDEYLRYYDPERYREYVSESAGRYAGVGVLFSEYKGKAYAVDVFPGSAAEIAGVEVGDFVIAIDGDRSQDWSLTETVNATSRNSGDTVIVTWRHGANLDDTSGEEFTTALECSKYTSVNVTSELIDGIGYISVKQMAQETATYVKNEINDLSAKGAQAFVLDIRDNPGGYLTQAVEIASAFVKSGTIVNIQTVDGRDSTKSATGTTLSDKPLVVLINENTGAASEILAAALKDNERATLVGMTSLGKGSVQIVRPLSFGGALRFTVAFYKSPLGKDIDGLGVVPDIAVSKSDTGPDNQKELALDTARYLIESP